MSFQQQFLQLSRKYISINNLKTILILIAGLCSYTLVLSFPPLELITVHFVNSYPLFIGILIFLFFMLFFLRKGLGEAASLVLTLVLFSLPLIYRWQTGFYDGSLIGGLLPFSDASGYYRDALVLQAGERFSDFSSRRPLFAGFLGVILSFTNLNLQLAVAVMGVIVALSSYLLAIEVKKTHGALAASATLIIQFLFFNHFIGKTLTENLGLALGALGIALIWRGAKNSNLKIIYFGLFVLTLALNARAGAFFVLPLIVLWGAVVFRQAQKFSFKFFLMSSFAIIAGFVANFIIFKVIGSETGQPFSNYAYTFYGLVSGNVGWAKVRQEFPGIQPDQVWAMAFQQIRAEPGLFIKGIFEAYKDFFEIDRGIFNFLRLQGPYYKIVHYVLYFFSAVGLTYCAIKRKNPNNSLLIAMTIGFLFSVALLPPRDSDRMRAYAVTIPLLGIMVGVGLSPLINFYKKEETFLNLSSPLLMDKVLIPFNSFIVIICLVGPLVIMGLGNKHQIKNPLACGVDETLITVQISKGSIINLVADDQLDKSYLPNIRVSDFRKWFTPRAAYPELMKELNTLTPGMSLTETIHLGAAAEGINYGTNVYLAGKSEHFTPGLTQVCAVPTSNEWVSRYKFYYIVSSTKQ